MFTAALSQRYSTLQLDKFWLVLKESWQWNFPFCTFRQIVHFEGVFHCAMHKLLPSIFSIWHLNWDFFQHKVIFYVRNMLWIQFAQIFIWASTGSLFFKRTISVKLCSWHWCQSRSFSQWGIFLFYFTHTYQVFWHFYMLFVWIIQTSWNTPLCLLTKSHSLIFIFEVTCNSVAKCDLEHQHIWWGRLETIYIFHWICVEWKNLWKLHFLA